MSVGYKRALVTGATGFIGKRLIHALQENGVEVHAIVLPGQIPHAHQNMTWHEGDIVDPVFVTALLSHIKPEVVFHLAAYGTFRGEEDIGRMIAVNVHGARNLLEAAKQNGCAMFVQTASAKEYPVGRNPLREDDPLRPWDEYAATKMAATYFCREAASQGLPVTVLRLSPVYGPGDAPSRFVMTAIRAALEDTPFTISVGSLVRNFTYIDDVVNAFLQAASRTGGGYEECNIGSIEAYSFTDVLSAIESATGKPIQKIEVPPATPTDDSWVLDVSKAKRILGWEPHVNLPEGIRKTVEWYREHA